MILIVLAAGRGSRIRKFTSKPKCLIEIEKKKIIQYLIENINVKFNKMIFVVGYRKKYLKKKINEILKNKKIFFVENNLYKKTNNSYSIYLTRKLIDDDVIFVNADLYINSEVNSLQNKINYKNFVFIDTNKKNLTNDDLTKVIYKKNKILELTKSSGTEKVNATSPGIYGFTKNRIHQHIEITKKKIKQKKLNEGFIEPINELIKKGLKLNTIRLNRQTFWRNVNSIKDIKKIKNFIHR